MGTKRPHLGIRLYWWAVLVLRLLLTHPARWQGERMRWESDRDRATMPPPWK
jgi:hypothetical protein